MITTESGEKHTLPTEVREHATTKTSVYKAGTLVYDAKRFIGKRYVHDVAEREAHGLPFELVPEHDAL